MDEVIFEEFKGTGNSEIRLRRDFAEKRIFPAIDVDASSTRREELLMSREELNIVWKLRRVIGGLDSLQGLETLLDRLKKTESNRDFMVAITKSMPPVSLAPAAALIPSSSLPASAARPAVRAGRAALVCSFVQTESAPPLPDARSRLPAPSALESWPVIGRFTGQILALAL